MCVEHRQWSRCPFLANTANETGRIEPKNAPTTFVNQLVESWQPLANNLEECPPDIRQQSLTVA